MAKESKSDKKPAVSKTTTKSASAKKTTTKSTTKSATAAKASRPKRTTSVSKTTTKSASAKKTTKKPVQKSITPGDAAPMVDTNFAAQAAARMLATRAKLAKAAGKYAGRAPDTAAHQRIVTLRSAGQTIKRTVELTGCSASQVKRIWAMHLTNSKVGGA